MKYKDYKLKDGRKVGIRPITENLWGLVDVESGKKIVNKRVLPKFGTGAREQCQRNLDEAVKNGWGVLKEAEPLAEKPEIVKPPKVIKSEKKTAKK